MPNVVMDPRRRCPRSLHAGGDTMNAHQMTRAAPILCLFTFVFSTSASADKPAQPEVLTNPEVNEPLQADVSAPLRDMATPPRADAPRRIIRREQLLEGIWQRLRDRQSGGPHHPVRQGRSPLGGKPGPLQRAGDLHRSIDHA